jgi:DnaJ-class molecular chaperone
MAENETMIECPACRGIGRETVAYDIKPGLIPQDPPQRTCPKCGGTGRIKAPTNSN